MVSPLHDVTGNLVCGTLGNRCFHYVGIYGASLILSYDILGLSSDPGHHTGEWLIQFQYSIIGQSICLLSMIPTLSVWLGSCLFPEPQLWSEVGTFSTYLTWKKALKSSVADFFRHFSSVSESIQQPSFAVLTAVGVRICGPSVRPFSHTHTHTKWFHLVQPAGLFADEQWKHLSHMAGREAGLGCDLGVWVTPSVTCLFQGSYATVCPW